MTETLVITARAARVEELRGWRMTAAEDPTLSANGRTLVRARRRFWKAAARRFPAARIEVVETIALPDPVRLRLERFRAAREELAALRHHLRREQVEVAHLLLDCHLTASDSAHAMEVAPAQLHKALAAAAREG